MYCVKCGVKLQDGVSACPLCRTPVWNPEQPEAGAEIDTGFPEVYPDMHRESNLPAAVALTVLCVTAAAGIFFLLAGMIPSLRRTLEKRFFF